MKAVADPYPTRLSERVVGAMGFGKDPLESAEQIAGWANTASALGVWARGHELIAFADGEAAFADLGCPMTTEPSPSPAS